METFLAAIAVEVTYASGCFVQMSRGQLNFGLFLCGLKVSA